MGFKGTVFTALICLLAKISGNYAALLVIMPLVSIINNQIMEVEAMNLTACNLAQKLLSLEDIEGGKFDVVFALAESDTDSRFLQSPKKNTTFSSSLVACVVDESHTVEMGTSIAGQLRIVVRSNHSYPNVLQRFTQDNSEYLFSCRRFIYTGIYTSFYYTVATSYF